MNIKLCIAAFGLSAVLCGCSIGAAGIGPDGSVQLNSGEGVDLQTADSIPDNASTAADSDIQQAPAAAQNDDGSLSEPSEVQSTDALQDVESAQPPDLSGMPLLEPEEETDLTALQEPDAVQDPVPAAVLSESDAFGLDQTLQNVCSAEAAAEISSYYAKKAEQAASQGLGVTTQVVYQKGQVLSILRTLKNDSGSVTLRSETFQVQSGGLFTLADFFPGMSSQGREEIVLAQVIAVLSESDQELYADWQDYASSAFDPDSFYLSSSGLVIYYQAGVVSLGVQQVSLPYSTLDGFVMPE